jgi:hypothetical protein
MRFQFEQTSFFFMEHARVVEDTMLASKHTGEDLGM